MKEQQQQHERRWASGRAESCVYSIVTGSCFYLVLFFAQKALAGTSRTGRCNSTGTRDGLTVSFLR